MSSLHPLTSRASLQPLVVGHQLVLLADGEAAREPGVGPLSSSSIIHHHYNYHHHHEPVDLDRPGQGAEVLLVLLTVGVVPDRAPHPAVVTAADLNMVQAESESAHVVKSNFCEGK